MSGASKDADGIAKIQDGFEALDTKEENQAIETGNQDNLRTRDEDLSRAWEVVETKRRTLGSDNVETISAMLHLASKLFETGNLHGAVLIQRQGAKMRQEVLGESNIATLAAMGNLGLMLNEAGLLHEALSTQREVLDKQQRFLGENNDDTVTTMNNLANTLRDLGQLQEALPMQREVLDRRRNTLGENDLDTTSAMHNLAGTLVHLGQYSEALTLQKKVLARWQEFLPEDDSQITRGLENLAITLQFLDQLDQALWLAEKVLESRRKVLGDEHPDTLRAMLNLASLMGQLGWHDERLIIQKQSLERCRTVFGEEHPTTISAIGDMTIILGNMGRLDENLEFEKEVLQKRKNFLGEDHPDTATSMHNLAITFYKLDRLDEAMSMGRQTLDLRRRILGDRHSDTISTMTTLVTTFDKLEQHDQSIVLKEELLEARKQNLGEKHVDTISATANLAVTLHRLNRLEEAVSLKMEVLENRKQLIGLNHPDTIWATVSLVQTLNMLEEYEQCAILEAEVLEKWKRVLGDEHTDTITAMSCLAITLERLGRSKEALLLRQDVFEKRRGVLGPDHLDTIQAMVDLVGTFDALKQYENSAILEAEVLEKRIKTLGLSHADTISARKNLSITLKMLGRLDEAEAINNGMSGKKINFDKQIPLQTMNIRGSGQAIWKRLSSPDNIRLVIVHSGTGDAALQGNIIEMDLKEAENRYIALSYTWGDPNLIKSIHCDGLSIAITANLCSSLQRLRQPNSNLRFWCDALCIDQGDSAESLQERSLQVQMMDRIFGGALRVVVDLGDDDGTLTQAVEGVNAILRTPPALRLQATTQPDPLTFLGLPSQYHPMWPALKRLMLRPWFRRIWCVQEAVLARDIRILFGNHSVTFDQLVIVAVMISQLHMTGVIYQQRQTWDLHDSTGPSAAAECVLQIYLQRKARAEKQSMSLCDLVKSTMRHQSTDRRDRLYALYGMIDGEVVEELPVDYSESHAQLSCRFSEYLIDNGHQVWALSHSGGDRPGRPSWTIDLGTLDARYSVDPMLKSLLPAGQSTSYSAGGSMEVQIRALNGNACLGVRGAVFDQIVSRTGVCPMPWEQVLGVVEYSSSSFNFAFSMRWISWINSVVHWVRRSTTADEEAMWRTLVADFNPHPNDPERKANGRALSRYGSYFERLIEWVESMKRAVLNLDPKDSQNQELEDFLLPPEGARYLISMMSAMVYRCVARTDAGALALVPDTCRPGDEIAIFQGFPFPFLLRKTGSNGEYLVVGICYVHGVMDGEILQKEPVMDEILLL